jgi:hypothetical protein
MLGTQLRGTFEKFASGEEDSILPRWALTHAAMLDAYISRRVLTVRGRLRTKGDVCFLRS